MNENIINWFKDSFPSAHQITVTSRRGSWYVQDYNGDVCYTGVSLDNFMAPQDFIRWVDRVNNTYPTGSKITLNWQGNWVIYSNDKLMVVHDCGNFLL